MDPMTIIALLGSKERNTIIAGILGLVAFYNYFLVADSSLLYTLWSVIWTGIVILFWLVLGVAGYGIFMYLYSLVLNPVKPVDWTAFLEITDAEAKTKFAGTNIPIETFIELYINQKADFKQDLYQTLQNHRYELFRMCFTLNHLPFMVKRFIPVVLSHTKESDKKEIQEVYDRGNDFYKFFLGESMLYTSGLFENESETLEKAQENKMDLACRKIHLAEGERLLDIGCGWGTFVCFAAKNYKAKALGITISKEGAKYGQEQIVTKQVSDRAEVRCIDYRDIPEEKWNKITCFEMAEHVGVKNFQDFLRLVSNRLEDDGIFYLQIAGLRRAWQFEDLMWGLFMNKYIFPGADASCPLAWYISQAEQAGFEVRSSETIGVHYSRTLKVWYDNWHRNKSDVVKVYGQYWFRLWSFFLGWSVIASGQGSATCYQIVMHKNTSDYNRAKFIGKRA